MMYGTIRRHVRSVRRRGAALVEMALILPLIIVMLLICVDFGRFATVHTAVTNAAREGANFGGLHPFTDNTLPLWKQKVRTAIREEIDGTPGFRGDSLTISDPEVLASNERSRVRVEVNYVFRPVILWPILPNEMKISRTAEMPIIRK